MPTLDFKGKQHIYAHHLAVPYRPLIPDVGKSATQNIGTGGGDSSTGLPTDDNLIIHGDNLHALKALLPRYAGRVKCIYIDPPYNTGNEGWVYNDRVNSPLMRQWLKDNGAVDGEDLERHDKWLCMMWPRLNLLKELLADDGVIFVSIDDNEQHHLRMLMDEIFGDDNFRNAIAVRRGVKNVQNQFDRVDSLNSGWEYILFYSKSADMKFPHLTVQLEERRNGSWNNHWRGTDRPTMRYALMGITPTYGQWRWSQERSEKAIENYNKMLEEIGHSANQDTIDEWWFEQAPSKPDLIRLSNQNRPEHYVPPSDRKIISSLWTDLTVNEPASMSSRLMDDPLDNPKRTELVKRVVEYICGEHQDAVILDSFAGSGTTAHAVLALNNEDGGNRKFILVECEDYADNITAERVRRVINGVPSARDKALQQGLGGSFTYCELGEPIEAESMLTGEALPSYSALAAYLLHTATGASVGQSELAPQDDDGYFHTIDETAFYLLYKDNLEWLCSNAGMLTAERAKRIGDAVSASAHAKRAIVFAPGKYIGQRELTAQRITFCQIPYEMHRAAGAL